MEDSIRQLSGQHLHVVLDEAFDPFRAVGAVVLTDSEYDACNSLIDAKLADFRLSSYMSSLATYEDFMENGFHGTKNPNEIASAYIDLIFKSLPGKCYIYFSNGFRRPDLGKKRTVLLLYSCLVQMILAKHRKAGSITFHFEDHEEMGPYFRPVVERMVAKSKVRLPVMVERCPKMSPSSLSLVDYLLWVFGKSSRWILDPETSEASAVDAFQVRYWRAINAHISLVYSLESGRVANRQHSVVI